METSRNETKRQYLLLGLTRLTARIFSSRPKVFQFIKHFKCLKPKQTSIFHISSTKVFL